MSITNIATILCIIGFTPIGLVLLSLIRTKLSETKIYTDEMRKLGCTCYIDEWEMSIEPSKDCPVHGDWN